MTITPASVQNAYHDPPQIIVQRSRPDSRTNGESVPPWQDHTADSGRVTTTLTSRGYTVPGMVAFKAKQPVSTEGCWVGGLRRGIFHHAMGGIPQKHLNF